MKQKILITRDIFSETVTRLQACFDVETNDTGEAFSAAELSRRAQDKAGLLILSDTIPESLLDTAPGLKVLSNMSVGYNNLPVAAMTRRGILGTNTPDVLNETTADFGWTLLMATARRLTEAEHFLRAGKWDAWRYDMLTGSDVFGSTLGIIGMGRIGQAIARRAQGFGMRVVYHNRSKLAAQTERELNAQWLSKDALLASADHIILVLPYSAETHYTIGARELSLMQPHANLINLARGGIVDDAALITALRAGTIAGAGLDVFEGEPAFNPDFLTLSNVVLAPHIASASVPTRRAMANLAADNLMAALGEGPRAGSPPNPVNPEAWQVQG